MQLNSVKSIGGLRFVDDSVCMSVCMSDSSENSQKLIDVVHKFGGG